MVFPAPFGPISETTDFSGMSNEMSSTANSPPNATLMLEACKTFTGESAIVTYSPLVRDLLPGHPHEELNEGATLESNLRVYITSLKLELNQIVRMCMMGN